MNLSRLDPRHFPYTIEVFDADHSTILWGVTLLPSAQDVRDFPFTPLNLEPGTVVYIRTHTATGYEVTGKAVQEYPHQIRKSKERAMGA